MDITGNERAVEKNHKDRMKGYFSGSVTYWRSIYDETLGPKTKTASWLIKRMEIIFALLRVYAGESHLRILDAGCGAGIYMRELIKSGHEVLGVDQSVTMAQEACDSADNGASRRAHCLLADVESLPIKEGIFDAVLCVGVLQYLKKDGVALKELSRVARTGGIIIVTLPNLLRLHVLFDPYYYLEAAIRTVLRFTKTGVSRSHPDMDPLTFRSNRTFWNRRYSYGQLDPVFREAGLSKLRVESVAFAPFTIWQKEIFSQHLSSRLSRKLHSWSKKSGFKWIAIFADRWVICLRKD